MNKERKLLKECLKCTHRLINLIKNKLINKNDLNYSECNWSKKEN